VKIRVALLLILAVLLAACNQSTPTAEPTATPVPLPADTPSPTPMPAPVIVGLDGTLASGTAGYPWWNDTVFYEVFVRSFQDSNGDGVGDLAGLIDKLDYLNDGDPTTTSDLGVTGIWLMPVAQSPSYHGYDVVDYIQVDDEYGSNEEFKKLMEEAHRRGIRVIVDLVLNHTSAQHPWFQEALDPSSPRRDWYVWSDTKPTGLDAQYWYPSPAGDGTYYYAYFWDQMPDLNYSNPEVTETMLEVVRFWLEEMGVDGFRLDAAKYLVETEGARPGTRLIENTAETHQWLRDFHTFYKSINPQAMTVGEVWADTATVASYIGDQFDLAFDFPGADAMLNSAFTGTARQVAKGQTTALTAYPSNQFATFLANHDQTRTRSRLGDDGAARAAATTQLAFAGVPFIYYGEEIGMQGEKPDENIRRPMQWTADGGFTTGVPWNAYFDDMATRHVAGQQEDPTSLLSHYKALIDLRNRHAALRVGDWLLVEGGHRAVYAFLRSTEAESILVVVNLDDKPVEEYALALAEGPLKPGASMQVLLGDSAAAAPEIQAAGGFADYRPLPTLAPYSSLILRFAGEE